MQSVKESERFLIPELETLELTWQNQEAMPRLIAGIEEP